MTVKLAPIPRQQYLDSSGNPYSGAKLFYYASGTTTKQSTYTTSAGDVANSNPIVLDASGRTPYGVWLTSGLSYKEVLAPSTDTDPPTSPIFTEDVLTGVNDYSSTNPQWNPTGLTPTYVNATQFTVAGDQTATLLLNRRVKITETAGTVYGSISVVAYTSLTTVTVVLDGGVLDSGMNSVEVGIITDLSSSLPTTITRNTSTQTLTNKSLSDSTTYIIDDADTTKKVQFQVSSVTTGTTRTLTVPDENLTLAGRGANTFTGTQTMSGKSIVDANASVAAHATTAAVWLLGNYVTLTGSATVFTDVADAPQAGAEVELYCNAAHTFTNNANFIVDGATDFVADIGDRVVLRAQSTSVFSVTPRKINGIPTGTVTVSKGGTGAITFTDGGVLIGNATGAIQATSAGTLGYVLTSNGTGVDPTFQITQSGVALGTPVASTSGTSIDFTGIPSTAKQIIINLTDVSTNGSSYFLFQLGDSGGVESTGYVGGQVFQNTGGGAQTLDTSTSGFISQITAPGTASVINGSVTLVLENSSAFTWVATGILNNTSGRISVLAGRKSTSATLDRVRITMVNGTDTFDAGEINISYL
jgi:hypothetical protein